MNKVLIGAIAVVVLIGAFLAYSKPTKNTSSVSVSAQPSATPTPTVNNAQNTITLTATGFNPQTLTIKAGTTVIWINKSGTTAQVNSDPHPIHNFWPFLNLGSFDDGGTLSATFSKPGTYTYHNHLNPSEKGTVIVE